ncbi:MAG: DUF4387 domain-containing protein [Alphaproteobacteria bacterium]|nr:DUF4387 domain-containing protein [Alphaproteobacteria bacterium]
MKRSLRDLAKIVRSKNSGPFEVTLDVVFDDARTYRIVKASGALSRETVAALYGLRPDQVLTAEFFDPALAFKATLPRVVSSGSPAERDTYGGQQGAPLLDIAVDMP